MTSSISVAEMLTQMHRLLDSGEVRKASAMLHELPVDCDLMDAQVVALGNMALTMGHMSKAIQLTEAALAKQSASRVRQVQMAKVYMFGRRHEAAKVICEAIVAADPNNSEAMYLMGYCHSGIGSFAEAELWFRRSLAVNPAATTAITGLSKCRRFSADADEIAELFKAALKARLAAPEQAVVYHALAKVFNDSGEFDLAWRYAANANTLLKMHAPFRDHDSLRRHIDRLMALYAVPQPELDIALAPEQPVLIVGMPRSGTTLMEQILSCHRDFYAGGEVPAIEYGLAHGAPGHNRYTAVNMPAAERASFRAAYARYFDEMSPARGGRITTKMLEGYLDVGFFKAMYPRAKFIYMKRDELDVAASVYFEYFSAPGSYANDLNDIAFVQEQSRRMMEFWCRTFPADVLTVKYEDLVVDFEATLSRVCAFLNIAREDVGDHTQSTNQVETPSLWQVRQGIYQSSVGRWRRYRAMQEYAARRGIS